MTREKTKLFKRGSKILWIGCFGLSVFLFPSNKAQAALWPGVDPQIAAGLTKIYDQIQGAMLGAKKQAASVAINQQMDSMLNKGGNNGGPMYIKKWDDYLVDQPKRNADVYINDYLSETTSGKGSLANYQSVSGSSYGSVAMSQQGYEGVGDGSFAYGSMLNKASASTSTSSTASGNYISRLVQGALAVTSSQTKPKVTYEGNPSKNMFSDGTTKNMSLYLSGINNPWAFNMNAQAKYQEKLNNEKEVAKTMAVSYQGFTGVGGKNNITNPGSLVKDMKAGYQNMNAATISNARTLPEIITSAVSQAMAKSVRMGIGNSTQSRSSSSSSQSSSVSQFYKFVNR